MASLQPLCPVLIAELGFQVFLFGLQGSTIRCKWLGSLLLFFFSLLMTIKPNPEASKLAHAGAASQVQNEAPSPQFLSSEHPRG